MPERTVAEIASEIVATGHGFKTWDEVENYYWDDCLWPEIRDRRIAIINALQAERDLREAAERERDQLRAELDDELRVSPQMERDQLMESVRVLTVERDELRLALAERSAAPSDLLADDTSRCAVCAWPLAESRDFGCVRGDCSYRPAAPIIHYSPERARRERAAMQAAEEKST